MDALYAENQQVVGPFFARYPELLPLYDAYVASADPVEQKRSALLAHFLPELKRRRKRQQALQAISAAARTDVGLRQRCARRCGRPARGGADLSRPALDDLTAVETPGLSAQFFFRRHGDAATADLTRDAEANLAYSAAGTNTLPANADAGQRHLRHLERLSRGAGERLLQPPHRGRRGRDRDA